MSPRWKGPLDNTFSTLTLILVSTALCSSLWMGNFFWGNKTNKQTSKRSKQTNKQKRKKGYCHRFINGILVKFTNTGRRAYFPDGCICLLQIQRVKPLLKHKRNTGKIHQYLEEGLFSWRIYLPSINTTGKAVTGWGVKKKSLQLH